MRGRIRNVVLFGSAVAGSGLLLIGVIALTAGDASGWRAVIGSLAAFALAVSVARRASADRRPGA